MGSPIETQGGFTPGPYWLSTATNGSHKVCGRNGKVICTYQAHQVEMATEHVRRLQAGHVAADRLVKDAGHDLLAALVAIHAVIQDARSNDDVDCSTEAGGYLLGDVMSDAFYAATKAIAKATGGAA